MSLEASPTCGPQPPIIHTDSSVVIRLNSVDSVGFVDVTSASLSQVIVYSPVGDGAGGRPLLE
jgi:hypothetical protein